MATVLVMVFALAAVEPQQGSTRVACMPPDVAGLTEAMAARRLAAVNLRLGRVDVADSAAPKGTVISQTPKPCSESSSEAVNVVLSNGSSSARTPERDRGSSIAKAALPLAAAAIVAAVIAARRDRPERSDEPRVERGEEPAEETAASPGATVDATVAPPPPAPVQQPVAPEPTMSLIPAQSLSVDAVVPQPIVPAVPPASPPVARAVPRPIVLPSRAVTTAVPSAAPVVVPASSSSAIAVRPTSPPVRGNRWPWILAVLLAALIAVVRRLRRERAVTPPALVPSLPFKFIPRVDAGVQAIRASAPSLTLDLLVSVDPGTQVFQPHITQGRIGVQS